MHSHIDIAKYLIDAGATLDIKDKNMETPFYKASKRGYLDLCRLFIQKGANINEMDLQHSMVFITNHLFHLLWVIFLQMLFGSSCHMLRILMFFIGFLYIYFC